MALITHIYMSVVHLPTLPSPSCTVQSDTACQGLLRPPPSPTAVAQNKEVPRREPGDCQAGTALLTPSRRRRRGHHRTLGPLPGRTVPRGWWGGGPDPAPPEPRHRQPPPTTPALVNKSTTYGFQDDAESPAPRRPTALRDVDVGPAPPPPSSSRPSVRGGAPLSVGAPTRAQRDVFGGALARAPGRPCQRPRHASSQWQTATISGFSNKTGPTVDGRMKKSSRGPPTPGS